MFRSSIFCRSADAVVNVSNDEKQLTPWLVRKFRIPPGRARTVVREVRQAHPRLGHNELLKECEQRLAKNETSECVVLQSQSDLGRVDPYEWLRRQGVDVPSPAGDALSVTEEESLEGLEQSLNNLSRFLEANRINENDDDDQRHLEEKTEAEMIADDCSQHSDRSKCFATALEVGVRMDNVETAEGRQEEPTPRDGDKFDEEEKTAASSLSDHGIPNIVYIKQGRPEVPLNEPLGECYNIPAPLLINRVAIRERFVDGFRRITGIGKHNIKRLQCDDTECRRETLIAL